MRNYRFTLPAILAIVFGLLTLLGLLFVPALGGMLTGWASFLAAVALLLGVFNLLTVHVRRLAQRNAYSAILVASMLAVFALALTDYLGFTEEGVTSAFGLVQAPLEAAMASLLAFFLVFSGIRLLQRQRSWWSVLFITIVILLLLGNIPMPPVLGGVFGLLAGVISDVFVNAGMRGILIGVALGTIAVSLRLLTGSERPYEE